MCFRRALGNLILWKQHEEEDEAHEGETRQEYPVMSYQSRNRKSVDCDYSYKSSQASTVRSALSNTAKQPASAAAAIDVCVCVLCTEVTCDSTNAL